ncbi:MAG: hypothetical protein LKH78_03135 [Weizmannia coagulans]|jgi:hypothetical protein|nr:hypothetical protein [Heyndrickxia coagulans]
MDLKVTVGVTPTLEKVLLNLSNLLSSQASAQLYTEAALEKVNAPEKEKSEDRKKDPAKDQQPDPEPKEDKPTISLEAVRAKLAELSQAGMQKEVKALINSYGVKKLTEIPKDKYAEVLEKAGELA